MCAIDNKALIYQPPLEDESNHFGVTEDTCPNLSVTAEYLHSVAAQQ